MNNKIKIGDNCPMCGGTMIVRKRKSDDKLFLGCNKYPACKHTVSDFDVTVKAFSDEPKPEVKVNVVGGVQIAVTLTETERQVLSNLLSRLLYNPKTGDDIPF